MCVLARGPRVVRCVVLYRFASAVRQVRPQPSTREPRPVAEWTAANDHGPQNPVVGLTITAAHTLVGAVQPRRFSASLAFVLHARMPSGNACCVGRNHAARRAFATAEVHVKASGRRARCVASERQNGRTLNPGAVHSLVPCLHRRYRANCLLSQAPKGAPRLEPRRVPRQWGAHGHSCGRQDRRFVSDSKASTEASRVHGRASDDPSEIQMSDVELLPDDPVIVALAGQSQTTTRVRYKSTVTQEPVVLYERLDYQARGWTRIDVFDPARRDPNQVHGFEYFGHVRTAPVAPGQVYELLAVWERRVFDPNVDNPEDADFRGHVLTIALLAIRLDERKNLLADYVVEAGGTYITFHGDAFEPVRWLFDIGSARPVPVGPVPSGTTTPDANRPHAFHAGDLLQHYRPVGATATQQAEFTDRLLPGHKYTCLLRVAGPDGEWWEDIRDVVLLRRIVDVVFTGINIIHCGDDDTGEAHFWFQIWGFGAPGSGTEVLIQEFDTGDDDIDIADGMSVFMDDITPGRNYEWSSGPEIVRPEHAVINVTSYARESDWPDPDDWARVPLGTEYFLDFPKGKFVENKSGTVIVRPSGRGFEYEASVNYFVSYS
jgi:hypothetical protein